ncbi:hypothetical protein ABPG75_001173 [Micractinium tetrahymenae]
MGKAGGIARSPVVHGMGAGRGMFLQQVACDTGEETSLNECSISTAGECLGGAAGVDCIDPGLLQDCSAYPFNTYCISCTKYWERHVCVASGAMCTLCSDDQYYSRWANDLVGPSQGGCYNIFTLHSTDYFFRDRTATLPASGGDECTNSTVTAVRLVDGPNADAGRLEVHIGGWWTLVCPEKFDNAAAQVVCRQLGKAGGIAHNFAFWGTNSQLATALGAKCFGTEPDLSKCQLNIYQACNPQSTAGVECVQPGEQ